MEPDLLLDSATVRRGRRTVLDELTWSTRPGVTALLGPNGAGKTTLMRAAIGLLSLAKGQRFVLGADATRSLAPTIRTQISWLPQDPGFPRGITVRGAVLHAAWLRGIDRHDRMQAASDAIALVNLTAASNRGVTTLSGGEQRRAALATAVVGSPRFLFLDEPTAGLDPDQRESILGALSAAVQESAIETVVLSTHVLEDVALAADHVDVLRNGKIVSSASLLDAKASAHDRYAAISSIRELYDSSDGL